MNCVELKSGYKMKDIVSKIQPFNDKILCVKDNDTLLIYDDVESIPKSLIKCDEYEYKDQQGSFYTFFKKLKKDRGDLVGMSFKIPLNFNVDFLYREVNA